MKINKKQFLILQEGILLDDLTNYTDFEKKILKSLHKRYKDTNIYSIYTSELTRDLTEKWGLSIDLAYKMAKTYIYKRDILFDDTRHVMDIKHAEILENNLNNILKSFTKTLPDGEHLGVISDNKGNEYDAYLWAYTDSFSIYIRPLNNLLKTFIFRCEIKLRDEEGNHLDNSILGISYKIDDKNYNVGQFEFELPEKLDNNSLINWVKSMIDFVIDKFSKATH